LLKFWEKLNILWKFDRFPRRTLENLIILGGFTYILKYYIYT
jgi:hypothetical protein